MPHHEKYCRLNKTPVLKLRVLHCPTPYFLEIQINQPIIFIKVLKLE